jgi:hypothetical protein
MARGTQPVRIPNDLIALLKARGEEAGKSVPIEVESRLRNSLGRGAWAEIEPRLTARSRALGQLIGFVANELAGYGQVSEPSKHLKAGVVRLLERLSPPPKLHGPENDAEMVADYWWLSMMNAHEQTFEDGAASPKSAEQRALLEIREALFPADSKGVASSQRLRKERK